MYEKFTDRARTVFRLANQEAKRFNKEYIASEHILLGLIKEGSGIAANVLNIMGATLEDIRTEIGNCMVMKSTSGVVMAKLPHAVGVKKIIQYAMEEAAGRGHNYVGTEHLLLGLTKRRLDMPTGVVNQVLNNLNITVEDTRSECLYLLGYSDESMEASEEDPRIAQIETLELEKTECVMNQQFHEASELRSTIDAIKKQIESECLQDPKEVWKKMKVLLLQQAESTTKMLELLKDF